MFVSKTALKKAREILNLGITL
ncbi:hypothetical protein D1835_08090 [Enterococcus asini]|nr:hypothetical protein [Enterococcus asini]